MAKEREGEVRASTPASEEFRAERPENSAHKAAVVETDANKSEAKNASSSSRVRSANEQLASAASEAGVDLEALTRRLDANPNDIYRLDQEEDEGVDPANAANVAEGERLARDAERRAADAFPQFDNVDPLIRARDAVQVSQENAQIEGLARVLSGAVKDEAGVPAFDPNNLPPEELDRRAKAAAAGVPVRRRNS